MVVAADDRCSSLHRPRPALPGRWRSTPVTTANAGTSRGDRSPRRHQGPDQPCDAAGQRPRRIRSPRHGGALGTSPCSPSWRQDDHDKNQHNNDGGARACAEAGTMETVPTLQMSISSRWHGGTPASAGRFHMESTQPCWRGGAHDVAATRRLAKHGRGDGISERVARCRPLCGQWWCSSERSDTGSWTPTTSRWYSSNSSGRSPGRHDAVSRRRTAGLHCEVVDSRSVRFVRG